MAELTQGIIAEKNTCVAKKVGLIANVRMLNQTLEEKQHLRRKMVRASETYK